MQDAATARRKPFYQILYVQVLFGIALGVLVGTISPTLGADLRPLGDLFIKLIRMVIGLVIFVTVVSGIGGMTDLKKMGRLGAKALIYFEIVSTLALLLGLLVGNLVRPGNGFNADLTKLNGAAVQRYAGQAAQQSTVDFLMNIVPNTFVDAFARGDILPIVFMAVLFGAVLSRMGERGRPIRELVDSASGLIFGVINVLMRVAPIGAFGAMAYTVGAFGFGSLGRLAGLVGTFYLTALLFVAIVLGGIAWRTGFSLLALLRYIKEELLIILGASSSDAALPALMEKMEHLGCSKPVVGLVLPTGYIFNADGTNIYMTLAALFVAQATNTDLSLAQQAAIFGVALLTSKGASGITGAGFIALVGTLSVVPAIPVTGMALILGVDRFMSEARALVNAIGNVVATIVMAKSENELDVARMHRVLSGALVEDYPIGANPGGEAPRVNPAR